MRKNKDFRSLTDPDRRPCQVGPPEAFSDEIAPEKYRREPYRSTEDQGITANGVFEESASVKAVLGSRCCGWTQEPTSEEFCDAVRSPEPTIEPDWFPWQQRRPTIPEATIYLEPDEKDE